VAISNVPLAIIRSLTRLSKRVEELTESIHNYFFAKTLEDYGRRRTGFITITNTRCTYRQTGQTGTGRSSGFVGAIRLPNNAFPIRR